MPNGFYIQPSYFAVIDGLNDKDRGAMWTALTRYAFTGAEPKLSGTLRNYFDLIRPTIEAAQKKAKTNTENGRRGGRPNNPPVSETENPSVFENGNPTLSRYNSDSESDKGLGTRDKGQGIKTRDIPSPLPSPAATAAAVGTERESETPADRLSLFSRFWDAYPRKQGKAETAKAWNEIQPSAELVAVMVSALDAQKKTAEWQRENGRFVPHPEKWLRERRWEDETQSAAGQSGSTGRELTPGERKALEGLFAGEEARQ